ncbi:MAG: AAA domain-containing protein, partial [Longimicrobiales bacterium]
IRGYNRDDVISTLRLHDWLERLRDELAAETCVAVPRPEPESGEAPDKVRERDAAVAALVERLTGDLPAGGNAWTDDQRARWKIAQLLEFHRREMKSTWWEFYRCMGLNDDELIEDTATLGGLEYVGPVGTVKRSTLHQYRFPSQDHPFRAGSSAVDPVTDSAAGEIVDVDDDAHTITLKRGNGSEVPHPRALIEKDVVGDGVLRDSVMRSAESIATHGLDATPLRSSADLLLRNRPRVGQPDGANLMAPGETTVEAAVRLGFALRQTVLPIQGPPGAGKTYTAARIIVHLLHAGKCVGITAPSHKVISNLLEEVCRAGAELGGTITGVQKAGEEQRCTAPQIRALGDNKDVDAAIASGARLIAGTAWLWSREEIAGKVDVLVVDEAGQFSLANAIAVAPAAESLVLVGDPQQLEQPSKGTHPPGVKISALDHLLGGVPTVPADR